MQLGEVSISASLRFRLLTQGVAGGLNLLIVMALVIVLSLFSLSGLTSSSPIVTGTCASAYHVAKYTEGNNGISVAYVTSFLSILLQVALCILVFPPLIFRTQPSRQRMSATYIVYSIQMLFSLIIFGKYLSFYIDLTSLDSTICSITFSKEMLIAVLAIATIDFTLSLLQLLAFLNSLEIFFHDEMMSDTYKAVMSNMTLPMMVTEPGDTANKEKFIQLDRSDVPVDNLQSNLEMVAKPKQFDTKPQRKQSNTYDYYKKPQVSDVKAQQFKTKTQEPIKQHPRHIPQPQPRVQKQKYPFHTNNQRQQSLQKQRQKQSLLLRDERQRQRERTDFIVRPVRQNTMQDEESINSVIRQQKEKYFNRPGGVLMASRNMGAIEKVNTRSTQGYLSYIRKLNTAQYSSPGDQTEGELIAVIRSKYKN